MENKDFEILNEGREKNGESKFINPRNATAGTLKNLDPHIVSNRPLKLIFHSFGLIENNKFSKLQDFRQFLIQSKLPFDNWYRVIKDEKKNIFRSPANRQLTFRKLSRCTKKIC